MTAQLIGPDNVPRVLEAAVAHPPGSYPFTFTDYDVEGTWHWNVQATDDLGGTSTIDRTFRYDTTLKGLSAPQLARGRATFRFTLSRAAKVRLQIETKTGVVMRTLAPVARSAGHAVARLGRAPAARDEGVLRDVRRARLRDELGRHVRPCSSVRIQTRVSRVAA